MECSKYNKTYLKSCFYSFQRIDWDISTVYETCHNLKKYFSFFMFHSIPFKVHATKLASSLNLSWICEQSTLPYPAFSPTSTVVHVKKRCVIINPNPRLPHISNRPSFLCTEGRINEGWLYSYVLIFIVSNSLQHD